MFSLGFILYGTTVLLPRYVQTLMGYTAERAGNVLSPGGVVIMFLMPVGKLVIELVRCLVLAYIIAHFVAALGISNWLIAAHFGLLLWVAFPVVLLTGSVIWENIPVKVAAIHAGDWLVKLLVIPIILSVWH